KQGFQEPSIVQTLRFSGDVSLSDSWKVTFNSGYDIENRKIIDQTSIGISRNLHCWVMDFDWTPFGAFQSYSVDLRVKASLLQDLKLSRRRSWFDQ
ncbi:MAG: LPS-assembly protein LptD, partial [Bacteroidota bacterium]